MVCNWMIYGDKMIWNWIIHDNIESNMVILASVSKRGGLPPNAMKNVFNATALYKPKW